MNIDIYISLFLFFIPIQIIMMKKYYLIKLSSEININISDRSVKSLVCSKLKEFVNLTKSYYKTFVTIRIRRLIFNCFYCM